MPHPIQTPQCVLLLLQSPSYPCAPHRYFLTCYTREADDEQVDGLRPRVRRRPGKSPERAGRVTRLPSDPTMMLASLLSAGMLEAGRAVRAPRHALAAPPVLTCPDRTLLDRTPGRPQVISAECSGQVIFGDLLASGQIRYTPEGHRGQTFTTPGNFLRSICLYYSEPPPTGDSWRIVYYKGIPLSLLRDATLSEENALAAIAAQSSMEHWVAEPRGPPPPSGEPSLPKCSPIDAAGALDVDKGRRPPRKRAREMSTPSERGVNLDSRERELDATQGVIQNARCDCGSVGEWHCGACQAHGESSGDSSSSSSERKVFEPAASPCSLLSSSTSSMAAGSSPSLPNLHADQIEEQEALEYNRCSCRAPCSLLPLIERELLTPGEGVLSVCCKGVLTFADMDAQGSIISVGRGGQKITYRFPCAFVRVARQRAGSAPLSAGRSLNIYSHVTYKGVRLDMVRPQPGRQSRR